MQLLHPEQHTWAVADQSLGNFDLEVEVRALAPYNDAGYGLLYRYQDPANHYLFAIGGDGYYTIALTRDGELVSLREWQQWPHVRRGAATNRLRVRCEQSQCRFYINGEFTTEISDDTFLDGKPALWAENTGNAGMELVFDQVRAWSLP
jgi:hypothetical protein